MDLVIKGRNVDVTEALADYAEEKVGRLARHLSESSRCELELRAETNPSIADSQVAEATIFTKGPVIRAREASGDMYASLDLLVDKLERQVKKYRGKLIARSQGQRRQDIAEQGFAWPEEAAEEVHDDDQPEIVKVKQFMVKPMTPEEAALQMELVGHDFFVFTSSDTDDTAVVYKRRDGNYGLIEPQR